MLRALSPHLFLAALIALAAGLVYALGGPVWGFYLAILLACAVVAPAYIRWDERHHQ